MSARTVFADKDVVIRPFNESDVIGLTTLSYRRGLLRDYSETGAKLVLPDYDALYQDWHQKMERTRLGISNDGHVCYVAARKKPSIFGSMNVLGYIEGTLPSRLNLMFSNMAKATPPSPRVTSMCLDGADLVLDTYSLATTVPPALVAEFLQEAEKRGHLSLDFNLEAGRPADSAALQLGATNSMVSIDACSYEGGKKAVRIQAPGICGKIDVKARMPAPVIA